MTSTLGSDGFPQQSEDKPTQNCFFNWLVHTKKKFLFRRNLFILMFGGQFQFSIHKSDVRNVNKCLPFTRVYREWIAGTHKFISKLKSHYSKYFMGPPCLVRIGKKVVLFVFCKFCLLDNSCSNSISRCPKLSLVFLFNNCCRSWAQDFYLNHSVSVEDLSADSCSVEI